MRGRRTDGVRAALHSTRQREGTMATSMFAGDSGRGTQGRTMAEMNITPLVDVMLVLLIIFMVAAPMVTRSIDLRLPQTPPPGPQSIKPPHLSLGVRGSARGAEYGRGSVREWRRRLPGVHHRADRGPQQRHQQYRDAVGLADRASSHGALKGAPCAWRLCEGMIVCEPGGMHVPSECSAMPASWFASSR